MDVKALYPSLDIDHSCLVIKQLIIQSAVKFEVDHLALSLHIAATHTQLEIKNMGLSDVVHTRIHKMGHRPSIISTTVTGTQKEREEQTSWNHPARDPSPSEITHMFAIAVSQAVKLVMRSHVYTNNDTIRLQQLGMAIGSTATAEEAKLVMLEHDRILWENCHIAGLVKIASGRYVDDENPVLKPVQFGERLIDDKLVICPEFIQQDKQVPHDKRTYDILQQIANKIWPNIQFTVDIPSECPSGLIPMLDMEVGINQVGQVTRQFYSKPMATPFTIPSRSAHTWQTKRSTLTQEGVRRLLNTSQNTSKIIRNDIMQQWDKKMNVSGYDEKFRTNVIRAAIKIYNHKVVTSEQGGRPLYRPTGWQSSERAIEKLVKRQTWYAGKGSERNQAPLIIDPTPTGQLELDIANILKDSARMSGTRVKLCLRGGDKVSECCQIRPFCKQTV